ncbi:acyltransferase family protein [Sphingobacterium corticis]|uniref:Acyltransferase family protein n=1 Tax=Sphingobacterium corticis TaxID=1812823 RepID=A0ABW5NH65_9SPHI
MMDSTLLNARQSEVIDMLRFPLTLLVVFIHMLPFQQQELTSTLSFDNLYVFTTELVSHHIGRVAVPSFFLFSGYFLFIQIKSWSLKVYSSLLKKRARTILVPYLMWNLVAILAIVFKNLTFEYINLGSDGGIEGLKKASLFDIFWITPVNFPLWYLRDLIVMILLSPVIFYFLKYLGKIGLAALFFIYITRIESDIPGISSTALFFFGLGSYFGIYKINMLNWSINIGKWALSFAFIFLLIATYYTAQDQNEFWIRLYAVFATAGLLYLGNKIYDKPHLRTRLLQLAEVCLFIYVTHLIYILNWLKGGLEKLSSVITGPILLIAYFAIPFICVLIIIALYKMAKQYIPKALGISLGNRNYA